ncbi:diguanylate cyclase [Ahrensia sp. R2A130]|nr:diguanylate cyclase [Ahrensia sp. R2A130]
MSTIMTDWLARASRHNSFGVAAAITLVLILAAEVVVTQTLGYFDPHHMEEHGFAVVLATGGTTALLAFPTLIILMKMTRRIDAMRRQLAQAVQTDFLTGTMSRAAFMETFERRQSKARERRTEGYNVNCRDALLVVDADHFKSINDRFGHSIGDAVLTMMGRVLHTSVRPGDHVGRLGGEEFGVYLIGCSEQDALDAAERLRAAIADSGRHLNIEGLSVTVSIGAVMFEPACEFARVFEKADENLYAAKDAGRNKVIFDDRQPLAA